MNIAVSQRCTGVSPMEQPSDHSRCEVFVLFTTVPETLHALRTAADLASDPNARIEVLVPEIVPYPLPLDRPAVDRKFLENRYQKVLQQEGIRTGIRICLCREPRVALTSSLKSGSVIVIGLRRRWWPTRETRLARWLEEQGHRVVVVGGRSDLPESPKLLSSQGESGFHRVQPN